MTRDTVFALKSTLLRSIISKVIIKFVYNAALYGFRDQILTNMHKMF
jgi:hypothetical protein